MLTAAQRAAQRHAKALSRLERARRTLAELRAQRVELDTAIVKAERELMRAEDATRPRPR